MLAVFVVINLFIAIVINNLEAAKRDEHTGAGPETEAAASRLAGIREQLEEIESALCPHRAGASDGPRIR